MQRMKDLRSTTTTIEEARELFDSLAHTQLKLERADAEFEAKIAKLKADHMERTKPFRRLVEDNAIELVAFIDANKGQFEDPRKIKTNFGAFGLQTVTDLVITDEAALKECLHDRGYDDCLKTTYTVIKKAVMARLEAKEELPGCHQRTGDMAVYSIKKALVDQARQEGSDV